MPKELCRGTTASLDDARKLAAAQPVEPRCNDQDAQPLMVYEGKR